MCGVQDKCVGTPSKKLRNFFVFHLEIKRRLGKTSTARLSAVHEVLG